MITLENVTYAYPKSMVPALKEVTATIEPGVVLLAGENGAGKTTLLNLIAGLAHPSEGECLIDGVPAASGKTGEMGKAFLLDERMFFPGKTIRQFAEMHSRFYPNFSNEKLLKALMAFGLTGDERMKSLSLGNLKKTQLAYVLALGVDVLLLDEPTNALDIESKMALRKIMASSVDENQTIIISTHTVTELDSLFDATVMLSHAALVYAGKEEDVSCRLSFEVGRLPHPEALYYEVQAGRVLNIVPADPDRPTKVDWRLLYSSLHSTAAQNIVNILNAPLSDQP